MEIRELTAEEYAGAFDTPIHVYEQVAFNELNKQKAASIRYLAFADTKLRLGIILGERADGFYSPFSAPFGGFSYRHTPSVGVFDEAISNLKQWASTQDKPVVITLPPLFYDERSLTVCVNALSRHGQLDYIDLNYHFPLASFADYQQILARNARKNLHHAMNEEWEWIVVGQGDDKLKQEAYDVIRQNREEHGYPLRMTWSQVAETIRLIPADFFLLRHQGRNVAAAQVFHVAEGIAQVIYWGDKRAYSAMRPMNYLSYRIFDHYHRLGLRILDIGPSTENGIPNPGLCDFKEGIGCIATPKFRFTLR